MTKKGQNLNKTLILIVLSFMFVAGCQTNNTAKRVLPILGNYDIEYSLVNGKEVSDTIYQKIPFFYYTNQDSIIVKSTDIKNKVWIADFFFTTCSTICPKMTKQMKRLQKMTKDLASEVQFISFSINPRHDQPHVFKNYIKHHQIDDTNWLFLTGNEEETHRLGIENFLVASMRDASAQDGYAHSEAFTLVDKSGYVRGVYNIADTTQVEQLEKDLRKLLQHEYNFTGSK